MSTDTDERLARLELRLDSVDARLDGVSEWMTECAGLFEIDGTLLRGLIERVQALERRSSDG